MTDYSITLPSYSIGEQVYKQIPTVCAPFGATAVVIGGHKAMAAVRERLLAAIQGSAVTITDLCGTAARPVGRTLLPWQRTRQWRQQI